MLSYVIAVAVTLVISIPVTFAVTSAYRKKETETKIGNAEDKAREIIDDAVKTAESKKARRTAGSEGRIHSCQKRTG